MTNTPGMDVGEINAQIGLRVPIDVIEKKRACYMRKGKPDPRPALIHDDDLQSSVSIPRGIPGSGPIRPSGDQRRLVLQTTLDHGGIPSPNAGGETQNDRQETQSQVSFAPVVSKLQPKRGHYMLPERECGEVIQ